MVKGGGAKSVTAHAIRSPPTRVSAINSSDLSSKITKMAPISMLAEVSSMGPVPPTVHGTTLSLLVVPSLKSGHVCLATAGSGGTAVGRPTVTVVVKSYIPGAPSAGSPAMVLGAMSS